MRAVFVLAALLTVLLPPRAQGASPLCDALMAEGPDPSNGAQMVTFGRFAGNCDLDVEYRQDDGSWQSTIGEWQFGWILRGRAIQDVWTVYRPGANRGDATQILAYGTTVRVFDPNSNSWHVNRMGVLNHNYTLFEARETDTEIVMNATDDEDQPFQCIFYDITDGRFRWRAQSSPDGGETRVVEQRKSARRRK